jgi:hypothetical protein
MARARRPPLSKSLCGDSASIWWGLWDSLRLDSDLIVSFRGRRAGMADTDECGVAEDGGVVGETANTKIFGLVLALSPQAHSLCG